MDDPTRRRLEAFLLPLYQDLDGASRFEEVERVARIARSLHAPEDARAFELLLLFHLLGTWLDKVGNLTRVVLAVGGLTESELRQTAASIRRLEKPVSADERAVAAALLIDTAGVRGLAERFGRARREGSSLLDVVREAVAQNWIPEWLPEAARPWLEARHEVRRAFCRQILDELQLADRR
ncbi:MAG TPA: hypothetical protein VF698_04475 [Thermoanaerobaculia bacterium]